MCLRKSKNRIFQLVSSTNRMSHSIFSRHPHYTKIWVSHSKIKYIVKNCDEKNWNDEFSAEFGHVAKFFGIEAFSDRLRFCEIGVFIIFRWLLFVHVFK